MHLDQQGHYKKLLFHKNLKYIQIDGQTVRQISTSVNEDTLAHSGYYQMPSKLVTKLKLVQTGELFIYHLMRYHKIITVHLHVHTNIYKYSYTIIGKFNKLVRSNPISRILV